MKRWMIMLAALAAVLFFDPQKKTDVGELVPVELLAVSKQSGAYLIQADTGDYGIGLDLETALADMRSSTAGEMFLETADYLILTEETLELLPQLYEIFRPATQVCVGIHADTQAAAYLAAHHSGVALKDLRSGERTIPVLIRTEERYHLESGIYIG